MENNFACYSNRMECGAVEDQLLVKYVKDKNGHDLRVKYCPDCEVLKEKKKDCLKCDKNFTPTCMYRHVCPRCAQNNSRVQSYFEGCDL